MIPTNSTNSINSLSQNTQNPLFKFIQKDNLPLEYKGNNHNQYQIPVRLKFNNEKQPSVVIVPNVATIHYYKKQFGDNIHYWRLSNLQLQSSHARRRRCLWRFKAVVNAVKFIMIYKSDTIRRVKKKIRMLSILRGGPLQRQRGTFVNHQQHTPLMELVKQERQASGYKQVQVDKYFTKLEGDEILPQQKTPKNSHSRKSPLQKYIDNLLKSTEIHQRKDYALQPLTKANKQYRKNLKTNSMWSLSGIKLSSIHSTYEKPITPFSSSSKQLHKSNEYDQNNKEIFRMIGNMKCQRRMIKLRK